MCNSFFIHDISHRYSKPCLPLLVVEVPRISFLDETLVTSFQLPKKTGLIVKKSAVKKKSSEKAVKCGTVM